MVYLTGVPCFSYPEGMGKLGKLIVGEPAAILGGLSILFAAIMVLGDEFWWDWTTSQQNAVNNVAVAFLGLCSILFVRNAVTPNSHLTPTEMGAVAKRQASKRH